MTTKSEKLAVARLVYKEIMEVISKWEESKAYDINCCWDECLWVEDEFFSGSQFRDTEE